jgi:hypothetical protein
MTLQSCGCAVLGLALSAAAVSACHPMTFASYKVEFVGPSGKTYERKWSPCSDYYSSATKEGSNNKACADAYGAMVDGDVNRAQQILRDYIRNRPKKGGPDVWPITEETYHNLSITHQAKGEWIAALDTLRGLDTKPDEQKYILARAAQDPVLRAVNGGHVEGGPAWDGWLSYKCNQGKVTISGANSNVRQGIAIMVSGGCQLTIKDSTIVGEAAIYVSGPTSKVTLVNSQVRAAEIAIHVQDEATLDMQGGSIGTREGPDFHDGLGETVRALTTGLEVDGQATATVRGARIQSPVQGGGAVYCHGGSREGTRLLLDKAELDAPNGSGVVIGQGCKVELDSCRISGKIGVNLQGLGEVSLKGGSVRGTDAAIHLPPGSTGKLQNDGATLDGKTAQY